MLIALRNRIVLRLLQVLLLAANRRSPSNLLVTQSMSGLSVMIISLTIGLVRQTEAHVSFDLQEAAVGTRG